MQHTHRDQALRLGHAGDPHPKDQRHHDLDLFHGSAYGHPFAPIVPCVTDLSEEDIAIDRGVMAFTACHRPNRIRFLHGFDTPDPAVAPFRHDAELI